MNHKASDSCISLWEMIFYQLLPATFLCSVSILRGTEVEMNQRKMLSRLGGAGRAACPGWCAPTQGLALYNDHLAQGITSSTSQSHLGCIYCDFLSRKELLKWMLGRMEASSARSDCVSAWLWSTALQLMWDHPIIVKKQNPGVTGPFHMLLSGCPPALPTWIYLWEQWNVPLQPLHWQGSPAQSSRSLLVCLQ